MSTARSYLSYVYADGRPTPPGWILITLAATGAITAVVLGIMILSAMSVDVPLPDNVPGGQATEVLDANGNLIGTLKGEQKRQIVPLEEISPHLQDAVVATEDHRFYEHSGVSFPDILRALFTNAQAGQVEQGGSTITQQYARNAFERVGTERTLSRKFKEIALARKIEDRYPKEKILEFYLNTIYFGRGAYGAEAAALTYFKKPAQDLSVGEAAFLAGAIRAPGHFQPDDHPQSAVRIRNEVLGDMVSSGYLSEAEEQQVRSSDLLATFALGPTHLDSPRAGFFMEHVRRLLRSEEYGFTESQLLGGGLTVHTTLDLAMQDAAEEAVSAVLPERTHPEAALVAMDPDGQVRAMVGGRDVKDRVRALGYNYAANVRSDDESGRPAGSAFKPLALARYLQNGGEVSARFRGPATMTIDSPLCLNADGEPWVVSNYGNQGFGRLDVTAATANSVNTIYAQIMADEVTPEGFMDTAEQLGISIPERDEGCALALGTTQVTPLEMAVAYSTFAARGERPEPLMITRVTGPNGRTLLEQSPDTSPVLTRRVADTVNQVLQRVIQNGTATGADIGRPAAGKTGTTANYRDAWFAGYTPDLTAVVWMGYAPDQSGKIAEMTAVHGQRVTGGSLPALIWSAFMRQALAGTEPTDFADPRDLSVASDPDPQPGCPADMIHTPDGGCTAIELPSPLPVPEPTTVAPLPIPTTTAPLPGLGPNQPQRNPSPAPRPAPTPSPEPVPSPTATEQPPPQPSPAPSPIRPSPRPSPDSPDHIFR